MLSIIQGIAFTDLFAVILAGFQRFTLVNWLQFATMLVIVIVVWNHFMGDALMTEWILDLEDAFLRFGTGALELVANHTAQPFYVSYTGN